MRLTSNSLKHENTIEATTDQVKVDDDPASNRILANINYSTKSIVRYFLPSDLNKKHPLREESFTSFSLYGIAS